MYFWRLAQTLFPWRAQRVSRIEELTEATDLILDSAGTGSDAYSIALLILGCIVRDEALDEKRCNLPDYPSLIEVLRQRNDALSRGDLEAVDAIKADVEKILQHVRKRALEMAVKRFWDSMEQVPKTTEDA